MICCPFLLSLLFLVCFNYFQACNGYLLYSKSLYTSRKFITSSYQDNSLSSKKNQRKLFFKRRNIDDNESINDMNIQCNNMNNALIGEDSAQFILNKQNLQSWVVFSGAVSAVLSFLYAIWIWDDGLQLGNLYKEWMESMAHGDSTITITLMLGFFAVLHSGMASFRPVAEQYIGPRAWRVIFALISLPLAFSSIVYFINHRYDGIQLWDLRLAPGMHDFVFWTSLISFYFLYPSTFNLLEVAAVEKPKLHLWETGIIRITRHPQMVGQLLWCFAHTIYLGTTFTMATSAMLCLHHIFACWNGDRRLRDKFGDKAESIFDTTSIVPFQAIISGKQVLPDNYIQELIRLPYLTTTIGVLIAYYLHPFMQSGATLLKW